MDETPIGELVTVAGSGHPSDGIVFDTPSRSKVVVAVVDPGRGPVFRTVDAKSLTKRESEGADDRALRLLIRRTPPPIHRAAGAAIGRRQARSGFKRGAMHRPTGK